MTKLRLMRMELEGEVKDLEAQLEAKKGALREVQYCRLLYCTAGVRSLLLLLLVLVVVMRMMMMRRWY